MNLKIDKVIKDGKKLILYVKKPMFTNIKLLLDQCHFYFKDYDNFLEPSLDMECKYVILTFILRNQEDILPYLENKGDE